MTPGNVWVTVVLPETVQVGRQHVAELRAVGLPAATGVRVKVRSKNLQFDQQDIVLTHDGPVCQWKFIPDSRYGAYVEKLKFEASRLRDSDNITVICRPSEVHVNVVQPVQADSWDQDLELVLSNQQVIRFRRPPPIFFPPPPPQLLMTIFDDAI